MSKSRLSKRREIEAAEAAEATGTTAKKTTRKKAASGEEKPAKKAAPRKKAVKRTRRAREAAQRRRLVWVVYSSTMREEGRFLYHERKLAEERLAQLLAKKSNRKYFIQPIKEVLNPDGTPLVQAVAPPPDEDMDDEVVKAPAGEEGADDVEIDLEIDLDADTDGDAEEGGEEEPAAEAE